jgi:DNA-binding MarR family transcriptional regulator
MLVVFFVDIANFVSILALSNKYRGELVMLENQRSEKKGEAPAEKAAGDGPLMPLLGLAFWRMKHAFEREVGISAATSFLLSMLIEEDGISQGEVSRRFEVDPSRITRLAQRLEADGLLSRERDPEDNRVVRLYATEEGRLLVESCQERRDGFEERIQGEFTFEELAEFRRALGVVTRLMEQ